MLYRSVSATLYHLLNWQTTDSVWHMIHCLWLDSFPAWDKNQVCIQHVLLLQTNISSYHCAGSGTHRLNHLLSPSPREEKTHDCRPPSPMPTYRFNLETQLWTGEYDQTQILCVSCAFFIIDGKLTVLCIQVSDLEIMVTPAYHPRKK